ncbi:hypothetical protein AAG906_002209 [Vitis piasezkii]
MKNKEDLLCLNLLITFLTSSIDTTNSNPLIPTMSKYDDDETYMDTPPMFNKRFTTNHLCKLKKFTKAMIEMEFQQS